MEELENLQFETKSLDHLGLVIDVIEELDLINLIDQRLPISKAHGAKVSMGERVAAMLMNGLGFVNSRLYIFPEFLEKKPIQRLFNREDIKADYFNDDATGRCLDAIAEYGVTKLFTELSFIIGKRKNLLGDSVHFDTSTLQLYGAYDTQICPNEAYEHYLLCDREQPDIQKLSRGFYLYKGKTSEDVFVLVVHDKRHHEILNLSQSCQGNILIDSLEWPDSGHIKITLASELVGLILSKCEHVPDNQVKPDYGYSKSHRHDLKQMVINLATTGKASFPIWMESHSGNASDKKILPQAAKKMDDLCKELALTEAFLYVADSAIYENILEYSDQMQWLSRVPENIKEAKHLVAMPSQALDWHPLNDGYSYHVSHSNYKGVEQRWLLIFSEQAFAKESKTLEKQITKEHEKFTKAWWHLSKEEFSCPEDATVAANKLSKAMKYHKISYHTEPVTRFSKRGRPKKNETGQIVAYKLSYELEQDRDKIEQVRNKKGRFVLASNQLDQSRLPDELFLTEYKAQSGTEKSFKFIKSNTFEVDSIFLKTPARIEALMMIMTLCLMVYGVSEYQLRQGLQDNNITIKNQLGRLTSKPSMQWIYFMFISVSELIIRSENQVKRVVTNINQTLRRIINLFGKRAQKIYLNPA